MKTADHVVVIIFLVVAGFVASVAATVEPLPIQAPPACVEDCRRFGLVPVGTGAHRCVCGGYGLIREVPLSD